MASVTTKLHCSKCESGIVKLIVRSDKKGGISADVKACDNKECKAYFGLKSIMDLKQVED